MAARPWLFPSVCRSPPPLHHHFPRISALLRRLHAAGSSRLPRPPSPAGSTPTHVTGGLWPRPPPDSGEEEEDENAEMGEAKKSRNAWKRETKRAVRWGKELAEFNPPNIKKILRAVSLDTEVYDALMLAKRLGPSAGKGRRRQFNYIGKLLRDVQQPDLMDSLIQASKIDDYSKLQTLMGPEIWAEEDDNEEDSYSEEEYEHLDAAASRWFDGLINRDSFITNEVYSLHNVDFDRQELRKLVQKVHETEGGENMIESIAAAKARKSLLRFLRRLAKQSSLEV